MNNSAVESLEPVVLYSRYSSNNQNKHSLEAQQCAALEYCEEYHLELVRVYSDAGLTGTNDRRPQFQQMIKDAMGKPEWRKILVYKLSRFSRNTDDQVRYEGLLKKAGIEIVSITEVFEDTAQGRHARRVQVSHNQLVSEETGEQTFIGMWERAQNGYHCGGCPPLGYTIIDRRLKIDEEEAETVRLIFQLYLAGYSYTRMARYLNQEGYRTKNGGKFTKNSFSSILTQEKYTGTYIWNKTRRKAGNGTRNSHAQNPLTEQVRNDKAPAIIDREMFDKVQARMKAHSGGNRVQHHYMLTGMGKLVCAQCGHTMQGRTSRARNGEKYTVYACPNHHGAERTCPTKDIRTDYLDRFVLSALTKYRFQPKDLPQLSEQLYREDDISRFQKRKKKLERAIETNIALLEKCFSKQLEKRYVENCSALDVVNRRLEELQAGRTVITTDNIQNIEEKMREYLKTSDDPIAREYLSAHIDKILYSNENVELVVETDPPRK